MIVLRFAIAAPLLVAATLAMAQHLPPPMIRDIPENQTLPGDASFEVLGLRLGATKQEIEAGMKQLSPSVVFSRRQEREQVRDRRGVSFSFLYDLELFGRYIEKDGASEGITVRFTTQVNGIRAFYIDRHTVYSQNAQVSASALMSGLEKRFGPPSMEKRSQAEASFNYVWRRKERMNFASASMPLMKEIEGCAREDWVAGYGFQRMDRFPGCSTRINVDIKFGAREDLVSRLNIRMIDRQRLYDNVSDTDAWVAAELEKIPKSPGASPKL